MVRTRHSLTVTLPLEAVFAFLSDVRNETQWRQSVVGSRYVGADAPAVGVDGETDVEMGPKSLTMRWTITEFTPGRHVAWALDGDPWWGGGSYTVTAVTGGVRIDAALEVRLSGIARALEPLLGVQLRQGLRRDLARLSALLPSV